jgi:hypothetical protein
LLECPPGKTVLGAGDMISWTDQLKVWCEYNGVSFGGFDPLSVNQFEKFIPFPGLGVELGEMMAFEDEFGYGGGDPKLVLPSEVSNLFMSLKFANLPQLGVPCPVTSWKEWIKKQNWSKVLGN